MLHRILTRFDILFEISHLQTEISWKSSRKWDFPAKVERSILFSYGNEPLLSLDRLRRLHALRTAFGCLLFASRGGSVHSVSRSVSATLIPCTRTSHEGEGERRDVQARLEIFLFVSSGRGKWWRGLSTSLLFDFLLIWGEDLVAPSFCMMLCCLL